MIKKENLINSAFDLWKHLNPRRKLHFRLLLILMVTASIAEMFTITAVLPFLAVISTPDLVFNNPYVAPINNVLKLDSPEELRMFITFGFIFIALLAGCIRVLLLTVSTKLLFSAGIEISEELYRKSLFQPYPVHVNRNSSSVINVVFNKSSDVIFGMMMPLMTIVSSTILLLGIIAVLITIDPFVMILTFTCFAVLYFFILKITSKKVKNNSKLIADESTKAIQCLQEGIGGIRDVIMSNAQSYYLDIYKETITKLRISQANNSIIGATPRFIVETLGIVLIAGLALYLTGRGNGVVSAIPVLGALAIGAQRILPTLQQCYSSVTAIKSVEFALKDVLEVLNQSSLTKLNNNTTSKISLENELSLENVYFRYASQLPYVLRDINLEICRGDRVGIIGKTGGGKSTLVDLVMGLLLPTKGQLIFDGKILTEENIAAFQGCIAHVPQSIYLTDGTIEQNIAFGYEKSEIDSERVTEVAKIAQLDQVIENLPNKYETLTGENGVLLSGGQRQRLGIARALYRESSIIIFDEATSALDVDTENKVIHAMEKMSDRKTLIMVAHRISTLKNCNKIIKIDEGVIESISDYEELSRL